MTRFWLTIDWNYYNNLKLITTDQSLFTNCTQVLSLCQQHHDKTDQSVWRAGVKQLFTRLWILLICSNPQSLATVLFRSTFILMMTLHSTRYTVIIWLAPWAARMNWILCCDWLPERAKCCYPARSGLPAVFRKKIVTKLVWSRWLDIGLILFYVFLDRDRVEVHKHELGQYLTILTTDFRSITYMYVWAGTMYCGIIYT